MSTIINGIFGSSPFLKLVTLASSWSFQTKILKCALHLTISVLMKILRGLNSKCRFFRFYGGYCCERHGLIKTVLQTVRGLYWKLTRPFLTCFSFCSFSLTYKYRLLFFYKVLFYFYCSLALHKTHLYQFLPSGAHNLIPIKSCKQGRTSFRRRQLAFTV